MSCETARRMMESQDPGLAEHVRSCAWCMVGSRARYYQAPAGLEEKIRARLRKEDPTRWPWRSMAMAAAVLLVASVTFNVSLLRSGMEDAVVSAHLRSLTGTHLLDVPSTDQHTVKPWFNGKLDFSPAVKEVEGFPLLGGRMEYLEGHPAAALVYGRRNHVINLFTWPSGGGVGANDLRQGFHVLSWWSEGMAYWAVSDLNEGELRDFARLYRGN